MFHPAVRTALGALAVAGLTAAWLPPVAAQQAGTPAQPPPPGEPADQPPNGEAIPQVEIVTKIKKLNEDRAGIQTQTGASVTTLDEAAIQAAPGGDNALLNQVVLQTPGVAQDSFGQFHVRGEHAGLQYRLNGVILPEGISAFGQIFDPRLISSMSLITGALPAEYGLRTAGIVDLTTKSGALQPGGTVSMYGGSHNTVQPSVNYAGSSGPISYFVVGDYLQNNLGIESPDGSSNPIHDRTKQYHGFGYVENVLDPNNRIDLMLGTSSGAFQIPNRSGLMPSLGLNVNGQMDFASASLNENQREITQFAILSWQHSEGDLDTQTALISRYSSLDFQPDPLGDLLFNGISQDAFKRNAAFALQSDAAYKLNDRHTIRGGLYVQADRSTSLTTALVLPLPIAPNAAPATIVDNSAETERIVSGYLQDEYRLLPSLTLNYGGRFDTLNAFTGGSQFSPRLNAVWQALPDTTVHGGYARYFSPPPFELVGTETIAKFAGTSAAPQVTQDDAPKPERADYFDLGVLQKLSGRLSAGVDSFLKLSKNLIDEGQFGAPIILTPFNYRQGRQYGVELTTNYASERLSAYGNLAFQGAKGREIVSSQFNFSQAELDYIAQHYIDLDHEQRLSGSAGASYLWHGTRLSTDVLLGSGLRANLEVPGGTSIPNGTHLPYYAQVNVGASRGLDLDGLGDFRIRFDIVNLFDRVYQIRNGTGVGVGAPQFGPRRGFFLGLSRSI